MVVKLDIFPHDVEIGLGEAKAYGTPEYTSHVQDAILWLSSMGWAIDEEWKFNRLFGGGPSVIEFKHQKHALLFKVTWG